MKTLRISARLLVVLAIIFKTFYNGIRHALTFRDVILWKKCVMHIWCINACLR